MRQVFISYSSRDIAQAQAVRGVLEQNGITCWMAPADIPGGSNYTKEIPIAIRGCQAFVLMLSDNAQQSVWVLKELDSAVNAGKIILPFQLEDVPLSDEFNFLLTGAQRYDAYQKKAEALQMLVARIKAIIDAAPQAEAAPEEPAPKAEGAAPEPPKKPAFTMPEFKLPQKPQKPKAEPVPAFGSVVCPACSSMDIQEFPNKIRPRGIQERLIHFLISVLPGLLVLVIGFVPVVGVLYEDAEWTWLALAVWGVIYAAVTWWSRRAAKERIRRMRVRGHIQVTECRCNTFQKKFQAVRADGAAVQ